MKYYKCIKCGFEFCRVGKVKSCPYCNNESGLELMTEKQQKEFIEKHMTNRKI